MKKIAVLILLLMTLAIAVSPAGAIIGGEEDYEHTNVGAIMMEWPPEFGGVVGRLCTATQISPQALATAAHCWEIFDELDIDEKEIWITFDQDPFAPGAICLGVEQFIPYPEFKEGGKSASDIALIKLEEPFDLTYEELPDPGYLDDLFRDEKGKDWRDQEFVIVGYGVYEEDLWEAPYIQLIAIRNSGSVSLAKLLEMEIKTDNNASHACFGDSGGPLFHQVDDDIEVLVGVMSRTGMSYSCEDEPTFHYRLDAASAQQFINDNLP